MLQVWLLPVLIVPATIVRWPSRSAATWRGSWTAATAPAACWGGWKASSTPGRRTGSTIAWALLTFNAAAFAIGFFDLEALQPLLPLNPDSCGMLAPSTIFNTLCSFLSNTNLQHYAGEQQLSYFSQIFFVCWKQFLTPAIGLAALLAMARRAARRRQHGQLLRRHVARRGFTSLFQLLSCWPWRSSPTACR